MKFWSCVPRGGLFRGKRKCLQILFQVCFGIIKLFRIFSITFCYQNKWVERGMWITFSIYIVYLFTSSRRRAIWLFVYIYMLWILNISRNIRDVRLSLFFQKIYVKTHNRFVPYLVGLIIGIIMFKYRYTTFRLSKVNIKSTVYSWPFLIYFESSCSLDLDGDLRLKSQIKKFDL